MYPELTLINQIKTSTGYVNVNYSEDHNLDIYQAVVTQPFVWVGHIAVHLHDKSPEGLFSDGYADLDNPELLLTNITFLAKREDFITVRTNIRNAYKHFSPYPTDTNVSNIFFIEGNVLAKSNSNIYWQETVGYIFPRIN